MENLERLMQLKNEKSNIAEQIEKEQEENIRQLTKEFIEQISNNTNINAIEWITKDFTNAVKQIYYFSK